MALDLYLQKDASLPETSENHFLAFEDNGYFWFLHEFFADLTNETGRMIDLYDDTFFEGGNLDLLERTVKDARKVISEKPDVWEEFIGTIVYKGERKVEKRFSTVYRKELSMILDKLEQGIIEAKKKNLGIFFLGD